MSLKTKKIAFIGGGNMAEALIAGLINAKKTSAKNIIVAEPRAARRHQLQKRWRVKTTNSNQQAIAKADMIVLAVKPQIMSAVLVDIADTVTKKHLIISIAAGIDIAFIKKRLSKKIPIIRTMPNTPALVGQGITGLYAPKAIPQRLTRLAVTLFESVGDVIVVKKETDLDSITALSGSGPAYIYLFLEAFEEAGRKLGFKQGQARQLALATCRGATTLASHDKSALSELRKRVTSKGGTTEAALKVLLQKKWASILEQAIKASQKRSVELRKKNG